MRAVACRLRIATRPDTLHFRDEGRPTLPSVFFAAPVPIGPRPRDRPPPPETPPMKAACLVLLFPLVVSAAEPGRPLRVDLNPPNGRGDIVTPEAENWAFVVDSPSRRFGDVSVALRSPSPLAVRWYKPLLVHGPTLTSDGVAADGRIDFILSGLSPGRHTLALFHNL